MDDCVRKLVLIEVVATTEPLALVERRPLAMLVIAKFEVVAPPVIKALPTTDKVAKGDVVPRRLLLLCQWLVTLL